MNNFQELCFRSQIEQVITEREALKAANQWREHRGEVQSYSEEAFMELCQRLANIEEAIRNAG